MRPLSARSMPIMSREELWFAAFLAALHRVEPTQAIAQANESLKLCDEQWRDPPVITTFTYTHAYPVGQTYKPIDGSLAHPIGAA